MYFNFYAIEINFLVLEFLLQKLFSPKKKNAELQNLMFRILAEFENTSKSNYNSCKNISYKNFDFLDKKNVIVLNDNTKNNNNNSCFLINIQKIIYYFHAILF